MRNAGTNTNHRAAYANGNHRYRNASSHANDPGEPQRDFARRACAHIGDDRDADPASYGNA